MVSILSNRHKAIVHDQARKCQNPLIDRKLY